MSRQSQGSPPGAESGPERTRGRLGGGIRRAVFVLASLVRRLRLHEAAGWYARHRSARQWTVNILGALLLVQAGRMAAGWVQPVLTPADLFPSTHIGPEAVEVAEARPGLVERVATYTGSVQPWEDNTVYTRVDGYVDQLHVYPGDSVRRGQLLATVETSNLEPRLQEAVVDSTFRAAEFRRDSLLIDEDAISAAEYDLSRTRYVTAAQKVNLLRTQIGYAQLRALTDGWVAERFVYPGQYVRAGDAVVQVDQLDRVRVQFHVAEEALSRIRPGTFVYLRFPQLEQEKVLTAWTDQAISPFEEAPRTELAQAARDAGAVPAVHSPAVSDSGEGQSPAAMAGDSGSGLDDVRSSPPTGHRAADHAVAVQAEVDVVFPAEDAATRTGIVEVRFPNPGRLLRTNTYVVGDFVVEEGQGVRVPLTALTPMPGGKTVVFVVPPIAEEGAVEEREVTVGVRNHQWAQILSGVEPGERVVHRGNRNLVDGQTVMVRDAGKEE